MSSGCEMLKQYLGQVCQELGIKSELALSSEGFYSVPFEETGAVEFKENEDQSIFLQATCCSIPKNNTESYLTLIMKAHLFCKETGHAFFGIDGKEENLLLSLLLPPRLEYKGFYSELEDFLNYVDSWREETLTFGEKDEEEKGA